MNKLFVTVICLTLCAGMTLADEGKFEPVKLEVDGLSYDLKKQEEYQMNNDVFEFKKWYIEPFEYIGNKEISIQKEEQTADR